MPPKKSYTESLDKIRSNIKGLKTSKLPKAPKKPIKPDEDKIKAFEDYIGKAGDLPNNVDEFIKKQTSKINKIEAATKAKEESLKKSKLSKEGIIEIKRKNEKAINDAKLKLEELRIGAEIKFADEWQFPDILPFVTGMNYCGPGTDIFNNIQSLSTENPVKPTNKIDELCMKHDIAFANSKSVDAVKKADKALINGIDKLLKGSKEISAFEKISGEAVKFAIQSKLKLENVGVLKEGSFATIKAMSDDELDKLKKESDDDLKQLEKSLGVETEEEKKEDTPTGTNPPTKSQLTPPTEPLELKGDGSNVDIIELKKALKKLDESIAKSLIKSKPIISKPKPTPLEKSIFTRSRNAVKKNKEEFVKLLNQLNQAEQLKLTDEDSEFKILRAREQRNENDYNTLVNKLIEDKKLPRYEKLPEEVKYNVPDPSISSSSSTTPIQSGSGAGGAGSGAGGAGSGAGAGGGAVKRTPITGVGGGAGGAGQSAIPTPGDILTSHAKKKSIKKSRKSGTRSLRPFIVEAGSNNIRKSRQEMEDQARDFANFSWVTPNRDLGVDNELMNDYHENIKITDVDNYIPPAVIKWISDKILPIEKVNFTPTVDVDGDKFDTVNKQNEIQFRPNDNFRYSQLINKSDEMKSDKLGFKNDHNIGFPITFAKKSFETASMQREQKPPLYFGTRKLTRRRY